MKSIHQQLISQDGVLKFRDPVAPTARLAAVGDLAFHGSLIGQISGDHSGSILGPVQEYLQTADITVGNLESVLVRYPFSPISPKANLVSGLGALQELKGAGFDLLTFANNHVMDAGADGLLDCLDGLDALNIPSTGAGPTAEKARQPVRISAQDIDFVFFAYSYGCGQLVGAQQPGCNEANLKNIQKDVRDFSNQADMKVVCLHMDAEFQATPAPDRMDFCRQLADSGVQIILCHHPHVPQGVELYKGALIVYSLGNFVFPMTQYLTSSSPDCNKSFLLEVEVDHLGPTGARIVPVVLDEDGRPVPPQGEVRAELLTMIGERSAMLVDGSSVRTNYRKMTSKYTRDLLRNLYWALGERNRGKLKLIWDSQRLSGTNRRWVRHFFQSKLGF